MKEKKKVRFTVLDGIILAVILIFAVGIGSKIISVGKKSAYEEPAQVTPAPTAKATPKPKKTFFNISYYFEEVPAYVAERIRVGDEITDEVRLHSLGRVTKVEVGEAVVYNADDRGMMQKSPKEGYASVKINSQVRGYPYKHGVEVSQAYYVPGHSMTLYAGEAKLYGRVSDVKKLMD